MEDCEDDTNRMDDCDVIKIEMEENSVPVDPAEILKHATKEEQGLVEEKSGNQDRFLDSFQRFICRSGINPI